MSMTHPEPEAIWKNFSSLNAIPRPSKKEEKITAFMKSFGEGLGLSTTVDETGNVLIKKPATKGMENRKTVILQAHLDMVCQKDNDTDFNFDTDAIDTFRDGDWIKARGTTLGADNGIGVATIMSILESTEIAHPNLEALFTVDEETGMTGAFGLQSGFLKGDILLNLDTEDDNEITIGCAGGIDVTATKSFTCQNVDVKGFLIEVKGLRGGHSGVDIALGRGNANVILSRLLFAGIPYGIRLAKVDGGGLRNAIPREAVAMAVAKDSEGFRNALNILKSAILEEFKTIEKGILINISETHISGAAISDSDSVGFIRSLRAAHNGVYRMSSEVRGLVETSNNIARVSLEDGKAQVLCLSRSSVESSKNDVAGQLTAAFELSGMEVTLSGSYPGWKPDLSASIINVMEDIYIDKFGEKPNVNVIHAGLECGIIGSHYPQMEMVSFGPTIKGAHSPEERVSISSVQKFWGYLLDILEGFPEK